MSLKSNYSYIRDWINQHFLKKEDVDLTQYPTHTELSDELEHFATKDDLDSQLSSYVELSDYKIDEDVIATALTDLDNRIGDSVIGEKEEKVIATALVDLNNRMSGYASLDSPEFIGLPLAPTPAVGTNNDQIATTSFVNSTINSVYSKINSGTVRPNLNSSMAGYTFLDVNLGKPIWWNGSQWIDANGNNV